MPPTRRDFIRFSLAAGALASFSGVPLALGRRSGGEGGGKGLKILILGGTGFLGPEVVEAALARGHTLTLFNRGRTEEAKERVFGKEMFPGVEKLYGNRDPLKRARDDDEASPMGLSALEGGRVWDAVVDTSGYVPRIVGASASLLRDRARHYTFISTVSVYAENREPWGDETRPVGTIPDTTTEEINGVTYGPLKALCERAAEEAMPGRVCVVRPGLIVGPGDPTDRFTYWPVRVSRGGEVLAPGTPDDPVQVIDVRDLAEWIVSLIERDITGVYNALGPKTGLTIGGMLEACRAASGADARFTWADAAFLAEHQVAPWSQMPVWIPPEGEMAGFHRWNCDRATGAGLRFRPIEETCRATLAWWATLPEERRASLRAGIKPDREAEVLSAWHERPGG